MIFLHWLSGRKNGVGLTELIAFMSGKTCAPKAKAKILETREEGLYTVVLLKGLSRPLYFPKAFDTVSLYQVIAEAFYRDDWHYYEIEETTVKPGDVVLDAGAAEGLFTLIVSERAERVYAVEPLPMFADSMRKTFHGVENVEIIEAALSDAPGAGVMNENGISSSVSSSGSGVKVAVDTVDDLFFRKGIRISYIKADLEGNELDMLMGAKETIRASAPRIAITTYHRAEHAGLIKGLLLDLNPAYRIRVKGIEERAGSPVMLHAWVSVR